MLTVSSAGLFSLKDATFRTGLAVNTSDSVNILGKFTTPTQEVYYMLDRILTHEIANTSWITLEYYVLPLDIEYPEGLVEFYGPTLATGVDIECELMATDSITTGCISNSGEVPTKCTDAYAQWGLGEYTIRVNDTCWHFSPEEQSGDTLDYTWRSSSTDNLLRSVNCPSTFFAIWMERPANPSQSSGGGVYQDRLGAAVLKCTSADKVARLTVTLNQQYQVLNVSDIHPLGADEISALYAANLTAADRLSTTFIDTVFAGIKAEDYGGGHQIRWFDRLMWYQNVSISQNILFRHPNITHIPYTPVLADTFEAVYKQLFVTSLTLYQETIFSEREFSPVQTEAVVLRNRVGVNRLIFILSAITLLFSIFVLVMLYWWHRSRVPGSLPTTLVGVYALLYASNAKEECGQVEGRGPYERAKVLEKLGGRYAYGFFEGEDGRNHFGVYRERQDEVIGEKNGVVGEENEMGENSKLLPKGLYE